MGDHASSTALSQEGPVAGKKLPLFRSGAWLRILLIHGCIVSQSTGADLPRSIRPLERNRILRLAVEADPRSLDAAQVFSNEDAMLGFLIFNTLIETTPEGGFVPVLAKTLPVTSSDKLTHTFHLRHGVMFSNGRELVADDVVYTFERFFDPNVQTASPTWFKSIAGGLAFTEARKREATSPEKEQHPGGARWMEPTRVGGLTALDRYTVRFRLDSPDLSFLQVLTSPPAGIIPRAEAEKLGIKFASRPMGTGPFVMKEWTRGARIRMTRNPHYFRSDLPGPEEVDVLVNVDRSTQAMMFERGEIDFEHYVPDPDYIRFKRSPRLASLMRTVTGAQPTFVFLNCEIPPFTNRLVRLALNYAVDKDALVKLLVHRAVKARGPLPYAVRGFNQDLPEFPYNPDKARSLLREAGITNGFNTTLWVDRVDPHWMTIALFVQSSLREVGVKADLKEVTYAALIDAGGRRGTVPMGTWDWVSAYDDPKDTLDSLLNGDNITDEGCLNNAFYANARVQQLFRDAVAETDSARRLDIYRQIERQVVEDVPWIFLVQLPVQVMSQPWLKGLQPRGIWPPARLDKCWLER